MSRFLEQIFEQWPVHAAGMAAVILVTALAYFIQVAPLLRDRERFAAGMIELRDKRQTLSQLQMSLHNLNAQVKSLEDGQSKHLKLAVTEVNERISLLSSLAADQGLLVETVEPGEVQKGSRYSTVVIRMHGTGAYPKCARFINSVRQQLPDTAITDLTLNGAGSGVAFNFILLWYANPAAAMAKMETN